jgi:hypothetical protein
MSNRVRYCLNQDARDLILEDGSKIAILRGNGPHFVDILSSDMCEGSCDFIKVRVFFPNGDIRTGKVIECSI